MIAYDPASNGWTNRASMPFGRIDAGVAAINGILYVVGTDGANKQVQAYNPASNSWTLKASMPVALGFAVNSVAVVDGLLYCFGSASSPVLVYDPVTDNWTTNTASMPAPFSSAFGVATINRIIYVAGGVGTNSTLTKALATFTPSPRLTNIVVVPGNPVIGVASNQTFTATGFFTDGSSSVLALTNGLIWASSAPTVATVDTNGAATGLTAGTTTITASVGSANGTAALTVVDPPTITTNPTSATVSPGGTAILQVGANGFGLIYQWALNGTNIVGATGNILTITNISAADIGNYTVTVSNPAGSVTSSSVMLASVDLKMFAGIIVDGPLGSNYLIQGRSNLVVDWTTLTNLALPTQPYIYIDYVSPTNWMRFYRAVPQ